MAESSDLTPEEWFARLGPALVNRREDIERWQRYVGGNHDLPAGPQQYKDAYKRFQRLARLNLCELCVNSRVHRMTIIGYRDGTARGGNDDAVWAMWQAAKLDARQFTIWRKAFGQSEAYAVVGPDPRDPRKPRVTIESPLHVIVEVDPAEPWRRLAALRVWHDPIAKRWMATLWLRAAPDSSTGWRYHYQSKNMVKSGLLSTSLHFSPRAWVTREEPARSAPTVPVVPFMNGDEGDDPRAAFDAGLDTQNRLNLTVLNRLTSERYAAFRQNTLTNFVPEEDETTGLPIPPFNPGVDQIWTLPPPEPGDPEPKFGQLAQTDTSGILRGSESDIRSFAAQTLTPVYYLPGGDLVNIGADTITALDAGHIASIRERMTAWGEGMEEVLQLMADIAELDKHLSAAEIVWAKPESFNPGAVADYASKLVAAKIPVPMVAEEMGWTPQRIERLRRELTQEALRGQLAAPATATPVPSQRVNRPARAQLAPAFSDRGDAGVPTQS